MSSQATEIYWLFENGDNPFGNICAKYNAVSKHTLQNESS